MSDPALCQIAFQPLGIRARAAAGTTLFEAARQAGIELSSACGGEGHCGQCQVVVLQGEVSPATEDEEYILPEIERQNGLRLACCTHLQSDVIIQIPRSSLITGQRLQVGASTESLAIDPLVRAYSVELPEPSLQDIRADLTRLCARLQEAHALPELTASPAVIRSLPSRLRELGWQANVYVRGTEIIGLAPVGRPPLGYAVDLGTTKIAGYLLDLETGQTLAAAGAPNPQIGYGEDVISRLNHASRKEDGGRVLAEKVQSTLDELLGELLEAAGQPREQVAEACIVGNTAMLHLLLELPVRQLATAPYVAAASSALDVRAAALGLELVPGAYVHIPPGIGGFVGADHVAMVLAAGLDRSEKVSLGVDIGTNTEISLRKPGQPFLTSASCASGPAFEGAHIGDGMRAASGAIEKVTLTAAGVDLVTIDDAPAVGLCGSGIIDTVAELYWADLLNQRGRFQRDNPRLRSGRHGAEFLLVPQSASGGGRDIVMTQQDVNEIQLAKGAIHAGLSILLEATDTPPESVEEVIIAGAFGSFLNVKTALGIGLFPHLPNAVYRQVGNAAASGARQLLVSAEARRQAQNIAAQTHYVELTTYPKFSRKFALGMLFPDKP